MDQLVGASELAKRLGLRRQATHQWRQRYPGFPEPVAKLEMGIVTYCDGVEMWPGKTGRLP